MKSESMKTSSTSRGLILLGFVSPAFFESVGRIYFVEIFFFMVVIHYIFSGRKFLVSIDRKIRIFFWLGGISIFLSGISSLINEIPPVSILKGISLSIFVFIDFFALLILTRLQILRVVFWLLGLAAGSILQFFVYPTEYSL